MSYPLPYYPILPDGHYSGDKPSPQGIISCAKFLPDGDQVVSCGEEVECLCVIL